MSGWESDQLGQTTVLSTTNGGFVSEQIEDHVGYVADFTLADAARISGVIVAVTRDALILEIWDPSVPGTNGDLITVDLKRISRISIE
jgi:hypothetical protein